MAQSATDNVNALVGRVHRTLLHRSSVNACDIQGCPLKLGSNVYTHTIDLTPAKAILDLMSDGVSIT
jgi:hypothetical protein